VREFLKIHRFPDVFSLQVGRLLRFADQQLKFYGGRSIVSSLFESPSDRKYRGISVILNSFSDSSFLLFGDSGEQDLELYLNIARERPRQILGIFIRDITSGRVQDVQDIPLARALTPDHEVFPSTAQQPHLVRFMSVHPPSTRSEAEKSNGEARRFAPASSSFPAPAEDIEDRLAYIEALSAEQQKILERAALWEDRVATARKVMPNETMLVFFEEPGDIRPMVIELIESVVR